MKLQRYRVELRIKYKDERNNFYFFDKKDALWAKDLWLANFASLGTCRVFDRWRRREIT